MKKKVKVLMVHGGMTFKNEKDYVRFLQTRKISIEQYESWRGKYLDKKLGRDFEIIVPRMPLSENARYKDWEMFFKRHLPYLKGKVIFIGVSLGGVFLAKYLSEHKLARQALSVYLVSPPFDNSLKGEDLVGGFTLKPDLSLLEKNTKHLHLLFSKDDEVVPVAHAEKYKRKLANAHFVIYKSKNGHFRVSTFPEIVKMIKADVKG